MRSSFLRLAVVTVAVAFLVAAGAASGEDYLVIKKKGGPTQKVPLTIPPDQIESFEVQSGPPGPGEAPAAKPGPSEESVAPWTKRPQAEPGTGQEPKTMELRPGAPGTTPLILKRAPEGEKAPAGAPRAERGPRGETYREREEPLISGPVAAELPKGKGTFFVNLYKLPENVKALPDLGALAPKATTTTDKINLDLSRSAKEPAELPENTEGLGMRCTGLFVVAGEGIFRFRVNSKDGARLHIDDKTLIENDGIHPPTSKTGFVYLAEGIHTIVLDSFNSQGTPVLQLYVTPPLGKEQIFSMTDGLAGWKEPAKPYDVLWGQVYFVPKGNYPRGPDFSKLAPVGRLIASELTVSGGEGFPGLPGRTEMVGLRYEGYFTVEGAGIFAFRLLSDYYAKVTIGEKDIVEFTGGGQPEPGGKVGWAFLQKGSYPIKIEYFHPAGTPRLELYVSQPLKSEVFFSPARTLVGYQAQEQEVSQIPAFVYFLKPGTKQLPNFNKLTPAGMFFTDSINYPVDRGSTEFPGVPKRDEWLGLRFYVKFSLSQEEAGNYKFRAVARDAARLILGKKMVLNIEGTGKTQEKTGTVNLEGGSHEMFLDFMDSTGPNGIQLFITPPNGEEKVFAFQ